MGITRRFVLGSLSLLMLLGLCSTRPTIAQTTPPNLITNATFEAGLTPWKECGGVRRVDQQVDGVQTVHAGRYAVRLGNSTTSTCTAVGYGLDPAQALTQNVTFAANVQAVTVSFWYAVVGQPKTNLKVAFGTKYYDDVSVGSLYGSSLPGWHLYREALTASEVQKVAGKTLEFRLRIDESLASDDALSFFVDDIVITPALVQTTAAALPADLRGTNTRPLLVVRSKADNAYSYGVYRMDTDGTKLQSVYGGQLNAAMGPAWSSDGTQIALIDQNVYPPSETDPQKVAPATALVVINPDGTNPRMAYQTVSQPGKARTPSDPEKPAFIQQLTSLDWSPDNRTLAGSIFAYQRYQSGQLEGGLSQIELIGTTSGQNQKILDDGSNVDWSRSNVLLFEAYNAGDDTRASGVWSTNFGATSPTAQQLLAQAPGGFDTDGDPRWSPDSQRFVTIRTINGTHNNSTQRNQALMLWSLQSLTTPRMLLLADHGTIRTPTWSPDGKYIAYTLATNQGTNIWWLDVASGTTGPITTDGLTSQADWRPACSGACSDAGQRKLFLPAIRH